MKPFSITLSALAGTWLALVVAANAQAPYASEDPLRRGLRPQQTNPDATGNAEPTTAPEPRSDLGGRRADPGARKLGALPQTDERFSKVHWDTDAQGTIWVRGPGYKASFGTQGATYFPLFGKEQPRHFPINMSLASATSAGASLPLQPNEGAVRAGDRVVIERGIIDEVYEIGLEGIEQTFVVAGRPQGDLRLFVSLDTELQRHQGAAGFEFSNEFGTVGYTTAFAREPNGSKHPLTTRPVADGIEIEIGEEYMSRAAFPLVVDPFISTFAVHIAGATDEQFPSVAYDVSTDRYLFVYEQLVTFLDGDIYARLMNGAGTVVLGEGYIDMTTENWYEPSVANLNAYDQFLVASSSIVGSANLVQGRLTNAGALSFGPKFTIANNGVTDYGMVSVGGDPYIFTPSYYCVSWVQRSGTNDDIHARLVTNLGTLTGTGPIIIDSTPATVETHISVSHSNAASNWNIAWQRQGVGIRGAQLLWNGAITTPSFAISNSASVAKPSASSPFTNGDYMVVWEHDFGPDNDIFGALLSGGTVNSTVSLSALQTAGSLFDDQTEPRVDCDGAQFVLGYTNIVSGFPDAHVSSFHIVGGSVAVLKSHLMMGWPGAGTSSSHCTDVYAQHSSGAASGRYTVAAWSSPNRNVAATFYEALQGGSITPTCSGDGSGTACPCGNNGLPARGCQNWQSASGAELAGTGLADVSSDTVVLNVQSVPLSAACLFFQGTSLFSNGSGIVYGDGLLCVGGSITRLGVKFASGGLVAFPGVGDPALSVSGAVPAVGGLRHYQVWYRDSNLYCASATFNLTNAASVVWLP